MISLFEMQPMSNVMEAVKTGFMSWGLLSVGLGAIFVLLVILVRLTSKKKDDGKK